jgi:hypothetical protein
MKRMKKKEKAVIISILFAITLTVQAKVHIDDGQSHLVNDYTYQNQTVILDWYINNNPGTHLELTEGGFLKTIDAHNNSRVEVNGGEIQYNLQVSDNAKALVSGGTINAYIHANDDSTIDITGGVINAAIISHDACTINVTGGMIDHFQAYESTIYIYGNNFRVDGVALGSGEDIKPYGVIDSYGFWRKNTITGTLQDGTALNAFYAIWDDSDAAIIVIEVPTVTSVAVDIKPGACPNPVNVKSKGVLPVAILGTEEFDVSTIDPASVRLNDVEPIRSSLEDVAAPLTDPNECECTTNGPDGFIDLTLKFKTQDIVESLGEVKTDDILTLPLTGVLYDGTPMEGEDCIVIVGRHKPINIADVNEDGVVNVLDMTIFAQNWLESSIVEE